MTIFYPSSDVHTKWQGTYPLDYHYLAIKKESTDNYVYCNYDSIPNKIDKYGISISIPLDASNIQVYVKCKAKAGSHIPSTEDPNNTHLIVILGYDDGIIDEVYVSKNFSNLTREWEDLSSLVYLNQPHHFHHYHSMATPGLEAEFMIGHPKPDSGECSHTLITHEPPPTTLTDVMILNEINYISICGILVDPSSYLYVSSLSIEVTYD